MSLCSKTPYQINFKNLKLDILYYKIINFKIRMTKNSIMFIFIENSQYFNMTLFFLHSFQVQTNFTLKCNWLDGLCSSSSPVLNDLIRETEDLTQYLMFNDDGPIRGKMFCINHLNLFHIPFVNKIG